LPENKQTAELAVTPILLSLTCWVFNDLKDLPPKRSDLYEQGINLLLEKWDEKRGVRRELGSEVYRKLSVGEKKKLLSFLAVRKFEQEQYVLFEQGELQGYIAEYLRISTEDSEAVLDAIAAQHGLLIERAPGDSGLSLT
jgi:predicted NACHT family NTPase